LHRPPLVEDQRLEAGSGGVGGVAAVPAILRQQAVEVDQLIAVASKARPKGHVTDDGQVHRETAGRRPGTGFKQRRSKGLIPNLGLAFEELVLVEQFHLAVGFA